MDANGGRGEITLILGGARSGKSSMGEAIIVRERKSAIYLATAQAHDDEMRQRIAAHREQRADLSADGGPSWRTEEIQLELAASLPAFFDAEMPILIDCLTLWLSNIMLAERDADAEIGALAAALPLARAPLVLVSNETGLGIVPENVLARRFRDYSGIMNRQIAALSDNVLFVAAGLPLVMKGRDTTQ